MKVSSSMPAGFRPFDITITIETEDDALTLMRYLNHSEYDLKSRKNEIKGPTEWSDITHLFRSIKEGLVFNKIEYLN